MTTTALATPDGDPILAAARDLAARGWRVIPIAPGAKHPAGILDWQNRATTDPDQIVRWWTGQRRGWGVGIVTGTASRLFVLDVDIADGKHGDETLADLIATYGALPETVEALTGSGGRHLYFALPDGVEVRNDQAGRLGPGLDIRGEGGQVLAPPTVHPNGADYVWEVEHAPDVVELANPPAWLLDLLTSAPASRAPELRRPRPEGDTRPGSALEDTWSWHDVLTADGATYLDTRTDHETGIPYQLWARPGLAGRDLHVSATLGYKGSNVLKVFTSNWTVVNRDTGELITLDQEATYTPFGYYAATRHGGDHGAAARQLRADGIGEPRSATVHKRGTAPATLPEQFWTARPSLTHIRQGAHARQRSADAVLHVILARLAAFVPYTHRLPGIVGAPAPLSYFAAIIATPGVGKSTANAIATELLPSPGEWCADQLPIGSGEGLIEALFDYDPDQEAPDKRKRQTRNNAYAFADEGQVLGEIGGRKGSTLLPTLRSIWTGGTVGQMNATVERRRMLPAGSYTYGFTAGFQPTKAKTLIDDADAGTPQRFGWAYAYDTSIPDDLPDWPGPLDWQVPPVVTCGGFLDVHPAIVAEIRRADLARMRREIATDPLDAHTDLFRLKVAALLAALDGRRNVNPEDWRLAGIVRDVSNQVRTGVVAAVAYETERREVVTRDRLARRAAHTDAVVEARRVGVAARRIADKVHREPDRWTVKLMRSAVRRDPQTFIDALDHAVAQRWVLEHIEAGQGGEKHALRPGPVRP